MANKFKNILLTKILLEINLFIIKNTEVETLI